MPFKELTLRLTADELPETEALLELLGAVTIAISDDADTPILEPAPGTTPLWPAITVRALFDANLDLSGARRVLGDRVEPGIETIDDADWLEAARLAIAPIRIGPKLRIEPAEDSTTGDDVLALHMGLAFGTGRHPTTRLCLEWLEREPPLNAEVLDYGAGTGVLALAALKLGARRAFAVDNDGQALDAAARNAELNRQKSRLWIGAPDALPPRLFDVIVANILAEPLIALASTFADSQRSGGRIALSGILEAQTDAVRQAYAPFYDSLGRRDADGWSLVTGRRR